MPFRLNPAKDFVAMNRHFVRGDKPKPYAIADHFKNRDLDVGTNYDSFALLAAEN